LRPAEIVGPIWQLAKEQKNVGVILAEVTFLVLNAWSVDADFLGISSRKIQFDYLVVAAGNAAELSRP
jgi:NADH:quinone reductase (non-electrogenic)